MPKKVAKDNDEEHLDIDPCDKDDPEEEENDDEDDDEAGVSTTKSALAAEVKKLKAQLNAANAALKAAPAAAPMGRVKYDHESTMKNLIDDTEEAVALMEKLKNDYEAVHYMGSLCDYWKSLMPLDRVQKNAHSAFNKYFKKYQHEYGLPPVTPSTAGSKTSSRAASVAPVDESIDEDDEEANAA